MATSQVVVVVNSDDLGEQFRLGERAVREVVTDLKTMGLVETWVESRGRDGRVKQIETSFDPEWVRETVSEYLAASDQVDTAELLDEAEESEY